MADTITLTLGEHHVRLSLTDIDREALRWVESRNAWIKERADAAFSALFNQAEICASPSEELRKTLADFGDAASEEDRRAVQSMIADAEARGL